MDRPHRRWLGVAAVLGGICLPAAAARADDSGTINGLTLDGVNGSPLVGVTVVAGFQGRYATAISNENGYYSLDSVPAGRWDLVAYYADATARRPSVEVAPPATTVVHFAIDTTTVYDIGCVFPMSPPPIDIGETAIGHAQEADGWPGPPWWRTVAEVTGATAGGRVGDVETVDAAGVPLPAGLLLDFAEEVEVTTAGRPARYGGRLGTLAVVTPRTGSNETHGAVFARGGAGSVEGGLEIGGPIARDHAWYHLGMAPTHGGGSSEVQMISEVAWAIDSDHQGGLGAWSVGDESGATLRWRSRFDDHKKEVAAGLGWLGATDTLIGRVDTVFRERAAGHHRITAGLSTVDARADSVSGAAYLGDSWSVTPDLTINGGLRYERAAIKNVAGRAGGSCSGRCEDVAVVVDDLAPRLGVVYDLTHEGRSRLFAHYGRYLETVGLPGFGGDLVVPGLRPARMDELVGGFEYNPRAIEELVAGISYVARRQDRELAVVPVAGGSRTALANPGEVDPEILAGLERDLAAAPPGSQHDALAEQLAVAREIAGLGRPDRASFVARLSLRYHGRDLTLLGEYDVRVGGAPVFAVADPGATTAQLRALHRTWHRGPHSVYSGGQIRELVSGPTLVDLYLGYRFHFGCAVDDLDLYLTGYDVLATGAAGVPHGAMVGARLGF